MIKLFIFDMGGVLARNVNVLPEAAARLGIGREELILLVEEDLDPLMSGTMTVSDFWERFTAKSGIPVKGEPWEELFRPEYDYSTEDLISRLKKLSFRVVCGTNTMEEHFKIHMEGGDYDVFDRVYASHRMGVAKPSEDFYRKILVEEGVSPEEALFIDDFPENVEAARSVGIKSFLFTDAGALEEELVSAGIIETVPK